MIRAGIYVRISQDREGAGERSGWTVAGAYRDDDVSAYSRKPQLHAWPVISSYGVRTPTGGKWQPQTL